MSYVFHLVNMVGIYAILALSLNIVAGYAGLLSLCHAAFYGIGAYGVALMILHSDLSVWQAVIAAVLVTGFIAGLVGAASVRFRSDYVAIFTFGFQILVFSLFNNLVPLTGGPNGIGGIRQPVIFGQSLSTSNTFAGLVCTLAVGSLFICRFIETSQFGRILRAVREDETFAQSLGINVSLFKISAFAISGAMAGLAGGIYATYITYIDPTSFTFAESLSVLTMVIVGGLGNSFGVVVGACLFTLVPEGLRAIGISGGVAANVRQVLFGACLVLVVFLKPAGLFKERIATREVGG
jgi:branched-chain amino acid transport system permease protein